MLILDDGQDALFNPATGTRLDPARRRWIAASQGSGRSVTPLEAARWLQTVSGHPLRQPVGVIGPRQASDVQMALAEAIGSGLATIGFTVVCGGRQGIMEAVCKGVAAKGGISIGLLPDSEADAANDFVSVPIATGLGEARNAVVARAAVCLIAIGNSHGTLSEVALGLQFGRPVIGLAGAADLPEVEQMTTLDQVLGRVAGIALGL